MEVEEKYVLKQLCICQLIYRVNLLVVKIR